MKLKEYIEKLQELYLEHGDLELVYAVDDEGNYYNKVCYVPGIMNMCGEDRISEEDLEEYSSEEIKQYVCIN